VIVFIVTGVYLENKKRQSNKAIQYEGLRHFMRKQAALSLAKLSSMSVLHSKILSLSYAFKIGVCRPFIKKDRVFPIDKKRLSRIYQKFESS
jgi:hypothetical protein